jgi:hypothetical protein
MMVIDLYLKATSSTDILFALSRSFRLWPVKSATFLEELRFRAAPSAGKTVWHLAHDHLHHGEVF